MADRTYRTSSAERMAWRIRITLTGRDEYLRDGGRFCEFATKAECERAIRSYEKGKFMHLKGFLAPERV